MKRFESLLFNIDIENRIPCQGSLLIAEPFLRESYFNHAVVCLAEYDNSKSTLGIVLNRALDLDLASVVATITRDEKIPLFCGGPLSSDRLYFIHTLGDIIPSSQEIIPGLYIGGDFDTVIDYINSGYPVEGKIRFFLGYSGWDVGQLAGELSNNVWAVTDIPDIDSLLTGEDNDYWHNMVRYMGNDYRGWLYHPINPESN